MIGLVTEHDIAISGHPGHPLLILLLITFKGEITSEKAISVNGNMAIHLILFTCSNTTISAFALFA